MSETRNAWARLLANWQSLDRQSKFEFLLYTFGPVAMAVAFICQFGWLGALFCAGYLARRFGDPDASAMRHLRRTKRR